jgi:hypothetical protein
MTQEPSPEEASAIQDPALVNESGETLATPPTALEVPENEPPPPPIEAPPVQESLAEQVYREAHTVPESTGPSDVVPNRPNIRSPESVGAVEQPEAEAVTGEDLRAEQAGMTETEEPTTRRTAAELIEAAAAATTTEELDDLEAQADGRVTVLDAVARRRDELAQEPSA